MAEMGIRDWLWHQLNLTKTALLGQGLLRGVVTVFYLLGPFFMLIERSPADAWLTLCGLAFLIRCVVRRDWAWTKTSWVRVALLFWAWCLISASLSAVPSYSIGEAAVWVRFPLFAFASVFWLARDPRILMAMLISMGAGMLIMSGILVAEFIIKGPQGARLSWPYGDLIPGNYLAKAGLPISCVLFALAISRRGKGAALAALMTLFTFTASLFSGERVNFILRVSAGVLSALVYTRSYARAMLMTIAAFVLLTVVAWLNWKTYGYSLFGFFEHLPFHENSAYRRVWNGGLEAFYTSPIFGIGPDAYRVLCPVMFSENPQVSCHTHPHNYYIQVLSETGLIGLVFALLMVFSITWTCFKAKIAAPTDVLAATCFVVPFAFFFPVQTTADFFGQWNNTFMWSAIAFSLAAAHQTLRRQDPRN